MTKVAIPTDASARTPPPAEGRAGRRGIMRAAAIRSDIRAMVRRKVRDDSEGDKSGIDTPWAPTLTSARGIRWRRTGTRLTADVARSADDGAHHRRRRRADLPGVFVRAHGDAGALGIARAAVRRVVPPAYQSTASRPHSGTHTLCTQRPGPYPVALHGTGPVETTAERGYK